MTYKKGAPDDGLVVVGTTTDNLQLGLMKNILEENEIPCMLKERREGSFMEQTMGFTLFGTDILVDKEMEPQAKKLLDSFFRSEGE